MGGAAEDAVLFEDTYAALRTAKKIPVDTVIVEDFSARQDRDKFWPCKYFKPAIDAGGSPWDTVEADSGRNPRVFKVVPPGVLCIADGAAVYLTVDVVCHQDCALAALSVYAPKSLILCA